MQRRRRVPFSCHVLHSLSDDALLLLEDLLVCTHRAVVPAQRRDGAASRLLQFSSGGGTSGGSGGAVNIGLPAVAACRAAPIAPSDTEQPPTASSGSALTLAQWRPAGRPAARRSPSRFSAYSGHRHSLAERKIKSALTSAWALACSRQGRLPRSGPHIANWATPHTPDPSGKPTGRSALGQTQSCKLEHCTPAAAPSPDRTTHDRTQHDAAVAATRGEGLQVAHLHKQVGGLFLAFPATCVTLAAARRSQARAGNAVQAAEGLRPRRGRRPHRPVTSPIRLPHQRIRLACPHPSLPCSIILLYWSVVFVAVSYHIKWLRLKGRRNDVLGW